MALWDKTEPSTGTSTSTAQPTPPASSPPKAPVPTMPDIAPKAATKERTDMKESLIASGLTIEGKINGKGHVRVAGKFKGDIQVEGDLHIDAGARVEGQVKANEVIVSGELQGNIESARHVELQQGGTINGDVKAGSLTVASGARMRGNVDFGFDESSKAKPAGATVTSSTERSREANAV